MERRLDRYGETPAARRASVFVGEGDREAPEPAPRHSRRREAWSQTPRDSVTFAPGRRQYPRWRRRLRPHLNSGKSLPGTIILSYAVFGDEDRPGWCTESADLDSELSLFLLSTSHDFEAKVIEVPQASLNPV